MTLKVHLALYQQLCLWGIFYALWDNTYFGKHHSWPQYCSWPCPSLYDHSEPSSAGYFQQDVSLNSNNHININDFTSAQTASPDTRSQSNRDFCDKVERNRKSQQTCRNWLMLFCQYRPKCKMLSVPCWTYAKRNQGCSEDKWVYVIYHPGRKQHN